MGATESTTATTTSGTTTTTTTSTPITNAIVAPSISCQREI